MSEKVLVTQISNAISAHASWKIKLRSAVNGGNNTYNIAEVRCDDKCDFGQWLHGPEIDPLTRDGAPYKVIKRLHAEFHRCAADILTKVKSGDSAEAENILDNSFNEQSAKLVRGLKKWKDEAISG